MTSTVATIVIVTVLCLAFKSTRLIGILGLALLFYFYPYIVSTVGFLSGIATYYFRYCH
jgi:hypothetical protein